MHYFPTWVSTVCPVKIVDIVTEYISDYNDTNEHNHCLSLICALKQAID